MEVPEYSVRVTAKYLKFLTSPNVEELCMNGDLTTTCGEADASFL